MSRILLHIGAPKCGSTFLQRVLLKNQARLRSAGVDYPHIGAGHPGNGLMLPGLTAPWLEGRLQAAHTIIFSHELLFAVAADGRKLARIAQRLNVQVQVIAFLRPFEELLFGDYSQTVKQALPEIAARRATVPPFEHFVQARRSRIQPARFLEDWQSLFMDIPLHAAPHTEIRPIMEAYVPALAQADWSLPKWRTNPSLRIEDCEALVEAAPGHPEPYALLQAAQKHSHKLDIGRTQARRALIRASFAQEAAALRSKFGINVDA